MRKNKSITKGVAILSTCILLLCCITLCFVLNTEQKMIGIPIQETTYAEIDEKPEETVEPDEQIRETTCTYTEADSDLSTGMPAMESTTESLEEPATLRKKTVSNDISDLDGWGLAYYEYINTYIDRKTYKDYQREIIESFTYSLLYVDDDAIPELFIDTNTGAGGFIFLTWHDGKLDDLQVFQGTYSYVEKGNLLFSSGGTMGHYRDIVNTIQDGKWVCISEGARDECYADSGARLLDEEGESIYEYTWNGESVSEADYAERLNTAYPFEQAIKSERTYVWDDILSIWKTGDVASAGHRYELIIDDLSWTDAESACKMKGGYLATLTSFEEWDRVTEQITFEGKDNITFWVGAKRYDWLEPEMKNHCEIFYSFWAEGASKRLDYVVLFYNKSDNSYYLNDAPTDLLDSTPSYTGKIGYICEYDE